jgi:hypothetical protein
MPTLLCRPPTHHEQALQDSVRLRAVRDRFLATQLLSAFEMSEAVP